MDGTPFWLEAKHHALVNIAAAIRQALGDRAKAHDNRLIAAITKSNRSVPLATMTFSEFMMLVKEWAENKAALAQVADKLKTPRVDERADEREKCAKAAEAWAFDQERIAREKLEDAPASSEAHGMEAIMARRIADAIRSGYAGPGAPGAAKPATPPVQKVPEPVGAA